MSTVILVPVLDRPHRVGPLVESIEEATPERHLTLFVCSPGDDAEQKAIVDAGAELLVLDEPPGRGDYARKINYGYRSTTEPFLFLAADDLHFRLGWLTAALRRTADPSIGVVGTQDLGNPSVIRGRHSTHSLVRRTYADRLGTIDERGAILHEGYEHNFVDNELVETAKRRGAWIFAGDSIVEHHHPSWDKAPWDETYRLGHVGFERDRRIFKRRSRLWR